MSSTARAPPGNRARILDGELLVNELVHEHARRVAVHVLEIPTPLGPEKDAAVEGDEREPFGVPLFPSTRRELAGAVLPRRDRGEFGGHRHVRW